MNFNFGEHFYEGSSFWSSLLVTIIGGLIGFGTALWIYYKQNQRNRKKEVKVINEEFLDTINYIKLLIDGIVTTIEQQDKKSVEFGKLVKANPLEIEELKVIANQDIDRIHKIDPTRIFLAYRHVFSGEENWLKDFQKLYNHLDFIQGHLHEIVQLFRKYQQATYDQLLRFKTIVDNMPDVMADMSLEIKKMTPVYQKDPRYIFLENSILKYRGLADAKAKIIEYDPEFILPVMEDIINKYQYEFFAPRLLDMGKKARVLINDITIDSIDTADSILSSPGLLEESKKYLEDISDKIKNALQQWRA